MRMKKTGPIRDMSFNAISSRILKNKQHHWNLPIITQAQAHCVLLCHRYQTWGGIHAQEPPGQKEGLGTPPCWLRRKPPSGLRGDTPRMTSEWKSLSFGLHLLCSHNHHITNTHTWICAIHRHLPRHIQFQCKSGPLKYFISESKGLPLVRQSAKGFAWAISLVSL